MLLGVMPCSMNDCRSKRKKRGGQMPPRLFEKLKCARHPAGWSGMSVILLLSHDLVVFLISTTGRDVG